jgi:hypothetical protein
MPEQHDAHVREWPRRPRILRYHPWWHIGICKVTGKLYATRMRYHPLKLPEWVKRERARQQFIDEQPK